MSDGESIKQFKPVYLKFKCVLVVYTINNKAAKDEDSLTNIEMYKSCNI